MTAEIAVFNRNAIALAADSAITVGDGGKIYNTANKLFTLSKYQPVGIMVYGNASIMGMPWETVIKTYRAKLGRKSFPHLKDYVSDFFKFLEGARDLFPCDQQEKYFRIRLQALCNDLVQQILKKVDEHIKANGSIDDAHAAQIIDALVEGNIETLSKLAVLPVPQDLPKTIIKDYAKIFDEVTNQCFEKLPLSAQARTRLLDLFSATVTRDFFMPDHSGVVIAGFGDDDFFPGCETHLVDTITCNRLRFARCPALSAQISFDQGAGIIPFAQSESAHTFIRGIDPAFLQTIRSFLNQILVDLPGIMVAGLQDGSVKAQIAAQAEAQREQIVNGFAQKMDEHSQRQYSGPIVDAVASLPKDELAAMAEAFVNLTSFKRRVTWGQRETVGGPIDVAVISKGDGFIWIKRKHYFQQELNQHFMRNYYLKEGENEPAR